MKRARKLHYRFIILLRIIHILLQMQVCKRKSLTKKEALEEDYDFFDFLN